MNMLVLNIAFPLAIILSFRTQTTVLGKVMNMTNVLFWTTAFSFVVACVVSIMPAPAWLKGTVLSVFALAAASLLACIVTSLPT